MKKTITISLLLVITVFLFSGTAAYSESSSGLPYYVSDTAGIVTEIQRQSLEEAAGRVSEQYGCGVYIVTLNDYQEFGSYNSFWDFSKDFYTRYGLGLGSDHTGILLIMSMADRDYSLIAHGSNAHYAFTDYGKEVLEKEFLDDFRRNDWNGGFQDYIDGCAKLLNDAAAGHPLDVSYESREGIPPELSTGIIIGVPLLAGFGACESMKRRMKPVRQKSRADEYILPGGINLSVKRDTFVNRTVTRTVIRSENRDSHYGGGGTTVDSQGFSGHSGKF